MRNDQRNGLSHQHCELNQEAIQQLFDMQPDNQLTPAEMTRRAIFPRWEIIRPAEFNPVDAEDQMLEQILSSVKVENEQHPIH